MVRTADDGLFIVVWRVRRPNRVTAFKHMKQSNSFGEKKRGEGRMGKEGTPKRWTIKRLSHRRSSVRESKCMNEVAMYMESVRMTSSV